MSTPKQFNFILDEIDKRIIRFEARASWYRAKALFVKLSTVFIAAMIAVLSGLDNDLIPINKNVIVLVLAALITVINAWGSFLTPRELWVNNTMTANKLKSLKSKMRYENIDSIVSEDKIHERFNEYQKIIDEHNEIWLNTRNKVLD